MFKEQSIRLTAKFWLLEKLHLRDILSLLRSCTCPVVNQTKSYLFWRFQNLSATEAPPTHTPFPSAL